ncbi:MAG: mobile mystery protein B [Flavobacteriales bacterium]|nr:mobile mystery protein B [Flavobacteriales bacterium]
MSGTLFDEPEDATPLEDSEKMGLIPAYISTRADLNLAEQKNITDAQIWAFSKRRDVLNEKFVLDLHRRMFRKVWEWAGTYRATERNIGIEPYRIQTELYQLLDDVKYQIEHETYSPTEIAARFHHRLVQIHPFPNGNGRHSRLMTDLLLVSLGEEKFTWGGGQYLVSKSDVRTKYIAALKAADNHDISLLLEFIRIK